MEERRQDRQVAYRVYTATHLVPRPAPLQSAPFRDIHRRNCFNRNVDTLAYAISYDPRRWYAGVLPAMPDVNRVMLHRVQSEEVGPVRRLPYQCCMAHGEVKGRMTRDQSCSKMDEREGKSRGRWGQLFTLGFVSALE